MKAIKYVIVYLLISSMLLINVCYGKQVRINENEINGVFLNSFFKTSFLNNVFTVEEEQDDLVKIVLNNKSLWINKKYVTEINDNDKEETSDINQVVSNMYKIVNTDSLNVRKENSINSDKITTISKDMQVEVLKTVGDWDLIKFNDVSGWVSNQYLKNINEDKFENNENLLEDIDRGISKQVYINTNLLNVRETASVNSNKIGSLTYFKVVNVVDIENEWYKIEYNDGYGFINSEYTIDKSELASRGDSDRDYSKISLSEGLADKALTYVGHKYVYGGTSPKGFDCSGLVYYVYKSYVTQLPRSASKQSKIGDYVLKENLLKGDLVFFGNKGSGVVEHVGIYIGNGNFVHAANSKRGVVVDTLESGYYDTNYILARRVI